MWLAYFRPIQRWMASVDVWFMLISLFFLKLMGREFQDHHIDNHKSSNNPLEGEDYLASKSVCWVGGHVVLLQTISEVFVAFPVELVEEFTHTLLIRIKDFHVHFMEVNEHVKTLGKICKPKANNHEEADILFKKGTSLLTPPKLSPRNGRKLLHVTHGKHGIYHTYRAVKIGFCGSGLSNSAFDMIHEMTTIIITWNFIAYIIMEAMLGSRSGILGHINPMSSVMFNVLFGLYKGNRSDETLDFINKKGTRFTKDIVQPYEECGNHFLFLNFKALFGHMKYPVCLKVFLCGQTWKDYNRPHEVIQAKLHQQPTMNLIEKLLASCMKT